ncbi:MAG: FHA domain-containing protein [Planctomycetota bacterium]|nr:FHA domain-containing protein [Planctomycetota bacterium]
MAVKPEFVGQHVPARKQPSRSRPSPWAPDRPPGGLPRTPAAPRPSRSPPPLSAPAATPFDRHASPRRSRRRSASSGPAARLEVVHGPPNVLGKVFTVQPGRRSVIGRDAGCEVPIPSDRVSRRHCQLEPGPGGYVLEDLGSSNGTLVNQERVQGKRLLRGGEYIQTGDCLLRFTL